MVLGLGFLLSDLVIELSSPLSDRGLGLDSLLEELLPNSEGEALGLGSLRGKLEFTGAGLSEFIGAAVFLLLFKFKLPLSRVTGLSIL